MSLAALLLARWNPHSSPFPPSSHLRTLLLLNAAPSSSSPSLPLPPPASGLGLWGDATKRNGSVEASETAPTSQKTASGEPRSCAHACE